MEALEEPSVMAPNPLSDEEFYAFCQRNPDLRFERESDGKLTVVP